jgi:glyoxylase-like metal-dependent hydrolase (beta-lactamase superfamily II)
MSKKDTSLLFLQSSSFKNESMVQGVQAVGVNMRVLRLPAIHHDANLVVVEGSAGNLLIDAGTSWYQSLQVERIKGVLADENRLDRIILTSKRYPCSGGAKHLSESFSDCTVHIHPDGQAALEIGDFFTTWANRFDSDMPPVVSQSVDEGDVFALGDGQVESLSLPGHSLDGMGYWIPEQKMMILGTLLPRADRPTRWDLPGGCLPDVLESLKRVVAYKPKSIIPLQGPAIKGVQHVKEILKRHIGFFEACCTPLIAGP